MLSSATNEHVINKKYSDFLTYFSVQCFVADLGFVDVDFNKRGLFPENTV